jgi:sterol desaturase/sphingolipid hydroxylase (fatty acid hydroxylase superfamily)
MRTVIDFVLNNPNSTQCALFAFVVVMLWLVERVVTEQPTAEKLRHTSINILYMCTLLPGQLLLMVVCVAVANWTTNHHWGLVYFLPYADNPLVKFGVMFLALDFLDYVYHFTAHNFSPIWKLHSLHHTDKAVDVSTTFRENPLETLVRVSFLIFWVFLCGASTEVLILRQTIETFANVSQHTVFRLPALPARALGWLFVTPNLHHIHHHRQRPGTNCNYGDVFSIWDRIFGTYIEIPRGEIVFGLDSHGDRDPDDALLKIMSRIFPSGLRAAWTNQIALARARARARLAGIRPHRVTQTDFPDHSPSAEGVHSIAT